MKKRLAFTLAEVLITLGIIGVVAAMTIPNLIVSNEKRTTVTRLKKSFSELSQVIRLIEGEYGTGYSLCESSPCLWDYAKNKASFEKYFMPHMKIARIYDKQDCSKLNTVYTSSGLKLTKNELACYQLMNGAALSYSLSDQNDRINASFWVFTNPDLNKKRIMGRHVFNFVLYDDDFGYKFGTTFDLHAKDVSRDKLKEYCKMGETKTTFTYNGQTGVSIAAPCTELIMRDGWNFSGDYPIKFK
jgi:prepilin-type N-terminal cleavage/methylation domain-containing protein